MTDYGAQNHSEITQMLAKATPKLGVIFRDRWLTYSKSPWQDGPNCGRQLLRLCTTPISNNIRIKFVQGMMLHWDITVFYAALQAVGRQIPSDQLKCQRQIEEIRKIRNILVHDKPTFQLTYGEFHYYQNILSKAMELIDQEYQVNDNEFSPVPYVIMVGILLYFLCYPLFILYGTCIFIFLIFYNYKKSTAEWDALCQKANKQ